MNPHPTNPGQAVRRRVDGTPGVTTTAPDRLTNRIAVMFVGGVSPTMVGVEQLRVVSTLEVGAQRAADEAHEDGLTVARRVSQWHIGDPSWANRLVEAYLRPDEAQAVLEEDMK